MVHIIWFWSEYLPSSQRVQFTPAIRLLYPLLHTQSANSFAPLYGVVAPASQGWHVLALLALVAVEYFPMVQLEHWLSRVAPETDEYLPATQLLQTIAFVAPKIGEYLPGSHSVQSSIDLPLARGLYRPAGHLTHAVLPAGAYVPGVQILHWSAVVTPVSEEAFPASQSVQKVSSAATGAVEYLPAPQSTQVLPLVAPVVGL